MKCVKCSVILLAAGESKRFSSCQKVRKQFFRIKNKTLLEYCIDTFVRIKIVKQIIVVVNEKDFDIAERIVKKYKNINENKNFVITSGGKERFNSVQNAIKFVDKKSHYILIHDVARPLVSTQLILSCLKQIKNYDGIIPGIKPVDTLKIVDKNYIVKYTVDRDTVVFVQTPQVFKAKVAQYIYSDNILRKWISKCKITDDAQLAELEGFRIKVIPGEKQNLKVTTIDDIELVKFYLNKY